jgi:dTDP-4-amino-4,6-dideoxygalactose transaminase
VDEARAPMSRNEIMETLEEKGIATRPGTHALHLLSYYRRRFDIQAEAFPNANLCARQTMAIPLHNQMTPDDYAYVVDAIHDLS